MENTNEFLAACFGAYAPCKVESNQSKRVYDVVGLNYSRKAIVSDMNGSYTQIHYDSLKLLLTPLSEILHEHAIEVAELRGWSVNEHGKLKSSEVDFSSNSLVLHFEWNTYRVTLTQEIFDYLRSKGYDCGFRHIKSLIEAGLALVKK